MKTVTRWVCSACKGVYFNAPTGRCPGCNGAGKEDEDCVQLDSGVVWHAGMGTEDPRQ